MVLTPLQRDVCRLLAENRIASGESYVAGGAALNEVIRTSRLSRDVDLFHDSVEALTQSWRADRALLEANGYGIFAIRERPYLVEAEIRRGQDQIRVEWARDSAFRFFPLVRGPESLPSLHPFDLATNKALALIGRLEPRDWIDLIACHERIQPLGLLCWAASGKDAGTNPSMISVPEKNIVGVELEIFRIG